MRAARGTSPVLGSSSILAVNARRKISRFICVARSEPQFLGFPPFVLLRGGLLANLICKPRLGGLSARKEGSQCRATHGLLVQVQRHVE